MSVNDHGDDTAQTVTVNEVSLSQVNKGWVMYPYVCVFVFIYANALTHNPVY